MNARQQHGFTLWELLMTLMVAGILLGIGVPNVIEFQRNGVMTAVANDAVTAVLMARTEAVKRQAPVVFCLSENPTDDVPTCAPDPVEDLDAGFIVWVDENDNRDATTGARILTDGTDGNLVVDDDELVLMRAVARGDPVRVSANCGYAMFAPTGFLRPPAAPCSALAARRILLVCDDRGRRPAAGGMSSARVVQVERTGRAQALQEQTQIDATMLLLSSLYSVDPTCPLPP
jgi:type IV fimbrial biogenesis protein FimT